MTDPCIHRGRIVGRTHTTELHLCSAFDNPRTCTIGIDIAGLQNCDSCPIRNVTQPRLPATTSSLKCDVVITSHDYGQFLADALDSIPDHSQLGSVVVVDDASGPNDTTKAVCESRSVQYIRVEYGNVYLARREGLLATSSPFVIFLDADDKLGPGYIPDCLKAMQSDETIGIVTTDLILFGDRSGRVSHKPRNIEAQNWIHAGSMARRTALEASQAYEQVIPATNSHADWYVWRAIVRNGWKAVRNETAEYHYRQHSASMMRGMRSRSYYDLASLATEPITLVVPLAGRPQYWNRLRDWIDAQPRITDILLIDSGSDHEFRSTVREWLSMKDIRSTKYVSLAASDGLADRERRNQPATYKAVQRAMPQIYRHLRESVTTEFIMVVEDDVLPPVDSIERLMHSIDDRTAAVSGLVVSRWHPTMAIGWKDARHPQIPLSQNPGKIEVVGGTGFGCLLLRRSAVLEAPPFNSGGGGNFDVEIAKSITAAGCQWKLDWTVRCDHAGIMAPLPQAAKPKPPKPQFMPCVNLGGPLRTDRCEVCGTANGPKGTPVEVRQCSAHGECSATRYKQMSKEQPAICNRGCQSFVEKTELVQLSLG